MKKGYHKMAADLREAEARADAAEARAKAAVEEAVAALREEQARERREAEAKERAADSLLRSKQQMLDEAYDTGRGLVASMANEKESARRIQDQQRERILELEGQLAEAQEQVANAEARIAEVKMVAAEVVAVAEQKVVDMRELLAKHEADMKKKRYEELRAIENRKVLSQVIPGLRR